MVDWTLPFANRNIKMGSYTRGYCANTFRVAHKVIAASAARNGTRRVCQAVAGIVVVTTVSIAAKATWIGVLVDAWSIAVR